MDSGKEQPYYGFSTFTRYLFCTTTNAIFIARSCARIMIMCRLKLTVAATKNQCGQGWGLIIKFKWPKVVS